jgi:D-alanyl-D-alanine dipeptidase
MLLVSIAPPDFDVELALAYAGPENFTGQPIYTRSACFLHPDAAERLSRAIELAARLDLRFRLFDGFRPTEAQWRLWEHTPDPDYIADPRRGSPHSRGVAIDLTLIDGEGNALDMGTAFDALTPSSHHASPEVSLAAQRNRLLLLGLMSAAGWDFYMNEWWHYQLFRPRSYLALSDEAAQTHLMS